MEYTQEELELMHAEEMQNSGMGMFHGNPDNFQTVSFSDLKFAENEEVFNILKGLIESKQIVKMRFGIEDGNPYYEFDTKPNKRKLYINKEILNYIYHFMENRNLDAPLPKDYKGAENATENYMFRLMKRDQQNSRLFFNSDDGYKGSYNVITISYGKLPYTQSELYAKIDSL